jgi:serine/threonine-protein phosphatase 2A regulatory subunit A
MAIVLKEFPALVDHQIYTNIINILINDSNDSVRIPIMDCIVALNNHPNLSDLQEFISNTLTNLSADESWRVRLTVGDKIHELLSFSYLSSFLKNRVVEIYVKLLKDKEAETRSICCQRLELISSKIGKEGLMDLILSELKNIEKDSVSYVRAALASSLLRISPLIGKAKTNDYIFPIFLNLIKDESHEIRMTLVKTFDRLHEVINIDIFVQSIIPSLLEIASNKSWRIRIQITESIPVLARILVLLYLYL